MKKYSIFLLMLPLCYACGIDDSKTKSLYEHQEIDSFKIENDTIFRNQIPVAIKVSSIQRFDNSQVLIIKKIDNNKTGKYHAK
ncbi:hypothetical protein [uncultured Psychroserpens sp.]|uniref:hypothetical protein n=1 Tax=uncultured Psychroserpens sp. TaxID=255436 RepID=UPI0026044B48|nr:hypothetical protein [uncultured Psychroserpens sp.]